MKESPIFVAGDEGIVITAIYNAFLAKEYLNIISQLHQLLDLQNK